MFRGLRAIRGAPIALRTRGARAVRDALPSALLRRMKSITLLWALAVRFSGALGTAGRAPFIVAGLAFAEPILGAAFLWCSAILVDEVLVRRSLVLLPWLILGFVFISGIRMLVVYADARLDAWVSERVIQAVRTQLYRHLVSVSPGSLGRSSVGDQLAHLSDDAERAAILLYSGPLAVFENIARILCYGGFLFFLSWQLATVALAIVPLLAWQVARLSPGIRRASRLARMKASWWMALVDERLGSVEVIQTLGAGRAEVDRFTRRSDGARSAELRTVKLQAKLDFLVQAVSNLGVLSVTIAAAYLVNRGAMSAGSVVAFIGAVWSLYDPIRSVSQSVARIQRGAASAQRIVDLLDRSSLVAERPDARRVIVTGGAVEFCGISFRHADGPLVLHDVALTIAPGETLAIVGPSGSGKSTLVRLLARLYDPSAGTVLIAGQDIRSWTLDSLRHAVTLVLQEPHIFAGSVDDNLRYVDPTGDMKRRLAAAHQAQVDRFATALPYGYASPVGPRGARLSGGERQRLALARALVREAPILVLDEATSAVDSVTEDLIQAALGANARTRTTIVIAHRLATIRQADRIAVMDQGRIVELGTPAELLRSGTRCHALFASQMRGDDICRPMI